MATNSWKYEEGEYNLLELCKKHPPPVIVQCNNEIGEVTVDNTTFDLSKPILLYRQRNINKVTAKIIHREIYREIGPPLLIPEDYKGWFAVLQKKQIKPGTLRQDILEFKLVAELSNSNTQTFLIGGTEKVHALQVTTFSDGKYQHQQRSLFPGEVLRRGKIYIGERKRKTAIFRRQKMKQDYYLLCTDECDREILLPFTQKGLFYTITTENGRMSCPVLQMKDLLDKKYLPATVKLLYGKLPNMSCEFTDTLRLEDSDFERSVIACTVSDKNNFIELPLTCSLKFRIFDMDETIVSSALYKRAFATCNEKVHVYMRGIKVCHEFGELKVLSEEEQFDNEMPPNPHILRKRKPLDSEVDDNRESGYIEMRPESFELTKDYLYTDMSQGGVPDSEIDLDDMDYVLPSAGNGTLHDSLQRSSSTTKSSKTPVIDRHQSFSLPPPTTPPPPLPHACYGTLPRAFHTYIELDSGLSDNPTPFGSLVRSRSRIEKAHTDQIYDIPRIPKRQSAPDIFQSYQTTVLSIDSMPILSESSMGEAIKYENFSILREVVPKPCGKNRISQRKPAEPLQYDPPQYDSPQNLDVVRTRSCNIHNSSSDSEGGSADSQYYFEELNASNKEVNLNRMFQTETERDFSDNSFAENGTNVHTSTNEMQNENVFLCESELGNSKNGKENKDTCVKDEPATQIDQSEEVSLNIVNNDNSSSNMNITHGHSSSQTLVADDNTVEDETELKVEIADFSGLLSHTNVDIADLRGVLSHTSDIENGEKIPDDGTINSNYIPSYDELNDENIVIATNDASNTEDQRNRNFFLSSQNNLDKSLFTDKTSTDASGNTSDIKLHKDKIVIDVQDDDNKSADADIIKLPEPNTEHFDQTSDSLHDKICANIDISCEIPHQNDQHDIDTPVVPTVIETVSNASDSNSDVNACLPDAHVNANDSLSYVNLNNSESDFTDEIGIKTAETKTSSFYRVNSLEDEFPNVVPLPCAGFNNIGKETLKETMELKTDIGSTETVDNQCADIGNFETADNQGADMGNIETAENQGAPTSVTTNETPIKILEDENPYVNTGINNEILLNEMVDVKAAEHNTNENMETESFVTMKKDTSETVDNVFDTKDFHKEIGSNNEQSNTLFEIKNGTCDLVSNRSNIKQFDDTNIPSTDKTDDVNPELDEKRNDDEIQPEVAEIKDSTNDDQKCSNIDHCVSPNIVLLDKPSDTQNNATFSLLFENDVTEDSNRSSTDTGDCRSSINNDKLVVADDGLSSNEMKNSNIDETGDESELSRMSTDDIVNEFRKLGVRKNIINIVRENNLKGLNFKNVQKLGEILPGVSIIDKRKISMFLRTSLSRKTTNSPKKTASDPLEPLWV